MTFQVVDHTTSSYVQGLLCCSQVAGETLVFCLLPIVCDSSSLMSSALFLKVFSLLGALYLRTILMGCHQIVTYACQNAGNPSSDMLKSGFFTISSQTDWEYSLENFNIVTGWSVVSAP